MTAKHWTASSANIALIVAIVLFLAEAASTAFGQADNAQGTARSPQAILRAATSAKAPGATSADDTSAAKPDILFLIEELSALRGALDAQSRQLDAQSEQLKEQQQRIQALEARLKTSSAAESASGVSNASAATMTAAVASSPAAALATAQAAVPQAQAAADVARQIDERVRQVGPFTFSGDFRLRQEPFYGGPVNQSLDRYRFRYRGRLNLNTKLNNDLSGGFALATGDINSPITTNQTANQDFVRKPFYLDRAFLIYTPHQFSQFSIVAGKFAYPWYRTELTWDNDVNPEGLAETLNFRLASTPMLKRIAVVGFQLPFSETKGVNGNNIPATNQSTRLSAVYGGQLQSEWQLAPRIRFTADVAFYNWRNADPVAFALQTANSASPGSGVLPVSVGTVQHSITVWKNSAGAVVNAQFASKFGLLDTIARLDITTPSVRWPVVILGDYVQNTKACSNARNFLVPAGSTASSTAACNPRQRRAYWLEGRFGRLAEKGDWQLAYTRMFIEREAVLGVFNFDDMRATSNITQHRAEAFYNVHRNVTLGFTALIGRPLASTEPYLKRLQGDVAYRF